MRLIRLGLLAVSILVTQLSCNRQVSQSDWGLATRNNSTQGELRVGSDLRVSSNRRYLQTADGRAWLYLARSLWLMPFEPSRPEIDLVLRNTREKGFTAINIMPCWHDRRVNRYGDAPWGPWILDRPNPRFFSNIDYIIDKASEVGLHVVLNPLPKLGCPDRQNEAAVRAYGYWLGARYRSRPNVIWLLGDDYLDVPISRALAESIAEGVTGTRVSYNSASSAWERVLMTHQGDTVFPNHSRTDFMGDAWVDLDFVYTAFLFDSVYSECLWSYEQMDPVMPVLLGEPKYENEECDAACVRQQMWHGFVAGAPNFVMGNAPLYRFDHGWRSAARQMRRSGLGGAYDVLKGRLSLRAFTGHWRSGLDSAGALHVQVYAQFWSSRPWWRYGPDPSFVRDSGVGRRQVVGAIRDDRRSAVVYFPPQAVTQSTIDTRLLAGRGIAFWLDPATGARMSAGTFVNSQATRYTKPGAWADSVLVLESD